MAIHHARSRLYHIADGSLIMPADRKITINVTTAGMRNMHGEYVPGSTTAIVVWASRRDKSQEDIEQEGGTITSTRRDWRIRWDRRIALTPVSALDVVDEGVTFNVLNMVEVTRQGRGQADLRRRFLDVQGVHVT